MMREPVAGAKRNAIPQRHRIAEFAAVVETGRKTFIIFTNKNTNMMKRLLLLASALIAVIGCGQNQNGKGYTVVKEFPVEEALEPVRVIQYDPVESNILALFRAGDWWISQNIQNYSGESGKCFSLLDGDFRTVAGIHRPLVPRI